MFVLNFFLHLFFNWDIFNIQHCKCKVYSTLIFCCWFSVWMNYALLTVPFVVQSLSHVQLFVTPWTATYRLPCPSLSPTVCSNSRPLSQWCHPTISSCHPLLLLPSSFPASGSFPMSHLFTSGSQSVGVPYNYCIAVYFTLHIISICIIYLDAQMLSIYLLVLHILDQLIPLSICNDLFFSLATIFGSNSTSSNLSIAHFSSVTQSCLTFCDPMDWSTPAFPVHHQLPELARTHIHQVGDAIQISHPLSSPSPPAFNLSQHQGLFQWVSSLHLGAKVLEFQLQHQSFQWIFRVDFH